MAKSKLASALDEIDALPKLVHFRSWFHKASPDVQELLLEVKNRWQSGAYLAAGKTKKQLHAHLTKKFGIQTTLSTFTEWLGNAKEAD